MKKFIKIISQLLLLISLISCSEDFLEKTPLSEYSGDIVWKDLSLMEVFVNDIYANIPHSFTEMMLASITDESILTYDGGSSNVTKSLVTPSSYHVFGSTWTGARRASRMSWDWIYKNIRACALFLEQVEKNTYDDENLKNRLTGEVYFLRAYHYHNLVFNYGGVPIVTKPFTLSDDMLVTRDSFSNCINFIADDCDKAADLLPTKHTNTNKGRATKGAALALKSRVLLWAASNLYHNQTLWSQGYSNPELIGYVNADRMELWRQAKNAAKAVMDLNVYKIHKEEPALGDNVAKNYEEIFVSKETSEDIFIRFFTNLSREGYDPGRFNNPNGYFGYGGNTPVSQTVDAYEMSDGTKFDWNNPEHRTNPYENREPRFYANINFEGAKWLPRDPAGASLDPDGVVQVAYYQKTLDGDWVPGADTRASPFACQEDGTYTGYYLRKFMDPTINPQFTRQECPWRYIRYTEVLLNYAEACLELGEDSEAQLYINKVRHRAGLPDINSVGDELREKLRHERRIELMFEDQRYWDIRRWMIAPQLLSTDAMGVDIRYYYGDINAKYTFFSVRERSWNDRSYFLPIHLDEMNRNNKLIQNPLY